MPVAAAPGAGGTLAYARHLAGPRRWQGNRSSRLSPPNARTLGRASSRSGRKTLGVGAHDYFAGRRAVNTKRAENLVPDPCR